MNFNKTVTQAHRQPLATGTQLDTPQAPVEEGNLIIKNVLTLCLSNYVFLEQSLSALYLASHCTASLDR